MPTPVSEALANWCGASSQRRSGTWAGCLAASSTDTCRALNDDVLGLFGFGEHSRRDLRRFNVSFNESKWDTPERMSLGSSVFQVTPRKVVTHIVLHEIRHWAQIGTLLRTSGHKMELHDFGFSPAMIDPQRKSV